MFHKTKEKIRNYILGVMEPYNRRLEDISGRMQGVEENVRNLNEQTAAIEKKIATESTQRLENLEINIRNNNELIRQLQNENNGSILETKIESLKEQIRNLKAAPADAGAGQNESAKTAPADSEASYGNIDYFSFENHFRGDEKWIKERQKVYLPYFEGGKNVLDLGCGRGEFLELLKENGVQATGVDFYDEFVIYCRKKGLQAQMGDAIAYVASLQEKTDGIFAGQLVEHLSTEQIIALCKAAYEHLEDGKYLIMETPNPMSLAIYTHAFYMDPSHQRPVHPLTLQYFAQKAGFSEVQILFTQESRLQESIPELVGSGIENLKEFNDSMKQVSEYLFGSQDYAVIAKK